MLSDGGVRMGGGWLPDPGTIKLNARFEDLKDTWRAGVRRVEEVLDARLKHLEER